MTEQRPGIIPESIRTQVAEHRKPSLIGLPKRKWAMTAEGTDGKEYIQLGSASDLETCAKIESDITDRKTTLTEAFRFQEYFMGPDREISLESVRNEFVEGELLVEGPSALPSSDGAKILPERVSVWVPLEIAVGDTWTIKDNNA